jgi:hypothetical protein
VTWLYFPVLLFLSFVQGTDGYAEAARKGDHFLGAPFVIAARTLVGTFIWVLVAAFVAGDAAVRDVETRMSPLTYTAPVRKRDYLGGRFLAAFLLNALIMLAVPAGVILSVYSPETDAATRGPFLLAAYVGAYLLVCLPNAFIATAVQFCFAMWTRRAVAGYLGGLVVLALSFAMLPDAGLPLSTTTAQMLDPLGVATLSPDQLTDTWTRDALNTRQVVFEAPWLGTRALWVVIALALLWLTTWRFAFRHYSERHWWVRRAALRRDEHSEPLATRTAIMAPLLQRNFGPTLYLRQASSIAFASFGRIIKDKSGLVILAGVALLAALAIGEIQGFMGVPLAPRTDYVINSLALPDFPPAKLAIPLLMIFWVGELLWRERDARVEEIVDATPVRESVLFLGKFAGLALVLALCMALRMIAGVLAQLSAGYRDFGISTYLQILFGMQLVEYLIIIMAAVVLHVVINQRHIGHLVALVAYVVIAASPVLGLQHHLLVYGTDPGWAYSEMVGFGESLAPWLWFKLYWGAWALLLAVFAVLLWVRGRESGFAMRVRIARGRFTPALASALLIALAIIVGAGSFIFYNTNVLNAYQPVSDHREQRAEYERRFGRYRDEAQPQLIRTSLRVELYPDKRSMHIRGTHRLMNNTTVPIDTVHVATDTKTDGLVFSRKATLAVEDDRLGHRIFALASPLEPGDSIELDFNVDFEARGFSNDGVDAVVRANGTHFTNQRWLPFIGYQPRRELDNAADRRDLGLPPSSGVPSLYDSVAKLRRRSGAEPIRFEAIIGTSHDQTAIAPGELRRTWTENGRRYFHYVSDEAIGNEYAFFSARYAVHEARWNDVAIQIFHHPGHDANVERMVRAVQASLSHYTSQFGAYPYRHVRLIERPGHSLGMHAEANTIDFGEAFSLLNPGVGASALDLPFFVVAHEVAHQWWGSSRFAPVEGVGFLSEALATFSAYQVVDKTYGREHLRRLLAQHRSSYEIPGTYAAVPLLRANTPYLMYRKGPFALFAVSEYIGVAPVNQALRRLLDNHAGGVSLPTTLDFYRELRAVTPDSIHTLLRDLFEANTYWELETGNVSVLSHREGVWEVTMEVNAGKVVVDTAGNEKRLPMNDLVQVGLFAPAETGKPVGKPLYLQLHRIRAGKQTITMSVREKPALGGIDPYYLLAESRGTDHIRQVVAGPPAR